MSRWFFDLGAVVADPTILRRPRCLWWGHEFGPHDVRWFDGQPPDPNIWRCKRCGTLKDGQ